MQRHFPPPIKEIITPPEYFQDEDMQFRMIDEKMVHDYAVVVLICSCLLAIVVMF